MTREETKTLEIGDILSNKFPKNIRQSNGTYIQKMIGYDYEVKKIFPSGELQLKNIQNGETLTWSSYDYENLYLVIED